MKDKPGYLGGIARRMYHDALAHPKLKTRQRLSAGAIVSLVVQPDSQGVAFFELRIARQGEVPNGDKLVAWDRECATFCRTFLVPAGVAGFDSSYGAFYYRLYSWPCAGNPFERVEVPNAKSLL